MIPAALLKRFQAEAKRLAAAKRKPRFRHVLGKLKKARLLDAPGVPEYGGPVDLEDVLWAGTLEPRVLEVLPALLAARPKYLRCYLLPADLEEAVKELRKGTPTKSFRGIPPRDYGQWVAKFRFKAARLKTFRLEEADLARLESIRVALGLESQTAVIRHALDVLAPGLK